jgi:hypothetical protein
MANIRQLLVLALVVALAGCASMPDATVRYYLAQSKISFKATRTVICDAKETLIIVNGATSAVAHSADRSKQFDIPLAKVGGSLSDGDVKVGLYEDGRLKDINASSTGQGETILKTIVSIVQAASVVGVIRAEGGKDNASVCARIRDIGGGKPLTLTYDGSVDIKKELLGKKQVIPVDVASPYATELQPSIGGVCAFVEEIIPAKKPLAYIGTYENKVTARQPGMVRIKVTAGTVDGCMGDDKVWTGELPVAQEGIEYDLPLPKALIFGKQVVVATFADSGALTSVQYISNTGLGQALNVTNAALTAAQNEDAQRLAATRAQADLIVQEQRLAQCLADRALCK